jgi:hypothetical protein
MALLRGAIQSDVQHEARFRFAMTVLPTDTVRPELVEGCYDTFHSCIDRAQGERLHSKSKGQSTRPKLLPISLNLNPCCVRIWGMARLSRSCWQIDIKPLKPATHLPLQNLAKIDF